MKANIKTIITASLLLLLAIEVISISTVYAGDDTGSASKDHETEFCDSTSNHGTSKSCKSELSGHDQCPPGEEPHLVSCSVGNSCDGGNGSWCTCEYNCRRVRTALDN